MENQSFATFFWYSTSKSDFIRGNIPIARWVMKEVFWQLETANIYKKLKNSETNFLILNLFGIQIGQHFRININILTDVYVRVGKCLHQV